MSSFQHSSMESGPEDVSLLERCPHFRVLFPPQLFSVADWTDVCLAHLFTAVDFRDNRLGVAYIAGRNRDDTGGICSPCELTPTTLICHI